MATKSFKVRKLVISTPEDLTELETFLNSIDTVHFITATDGSIIVIYTEK